MPNSMTGFGKATCEFNGQMVSVELSAVNHRYLDCGLRISNAWSALEPVLKGVVRKRLARGKVNVTVNRKRPMSADQTVKFDAEIARQYVDSAKELSAILGCDAVLSIDTLAAMDGVFYHEEPEQDLEEIKQMLVGVLKEALKQLDAMRVAEGEALALDLRHRLSLIRKALAAIEARLPELNERYGERIRARIDDLQANVTITEERIAIEVAMLADKADVTEEVVRLKTHLDHMEELLDSSEPVGRRMDFLSQEIQREVNTLGVKTRDADVAKDVLDMKAELEKIREQVQNIE